MQQAQKGNGFMRLESKNGQKSPGERCPEKQRTGQYIADQEPGEISYNQGINKTWGKNKK